MSTAAPIVRVVVAAVAASTLLIGCTGGQAPAPNDYGDVNTDNEGYYGNFMFGCTGVEANDDGKYVDVKLENPDFCTCVFEQLKETVPFPQMESFEEAQADAPEGTDITIPPDIDAAREQCAGSAGQG